MKRVNSESKVKQGLNIAESCASSTSVKTSNSIQSNERKSTEFFTPGTRYLCIKSVKGDFTKGSIYEQSSDPTKWYGYFRNDKGILHVWPQPDNIAHNCDLYDMKPEDIDPRLYFEPVEEITEAEGIKIGDKVRHNKHEEVATVTAIREAFDNVCDGYRYLYTLDFGQSVTGPFSVELNGGEFLREAFTPCTPNGEDSNANIDPRFTLNRYNISPASKYINDLGTMCANIRPEDDPEGERLGYCRYMTKKPGGEWTENRCMSWHSLEYSLYVFNAREMTSAESVEDRDGMEKPTDINSLAANIDRLLKRIASRGTAFAEVLSYIECYPDMGREFLNAMQCRDSLDHFRRWCAARQKHLRRKSA